MGEARRKEADARTVAYSKTDRCIFCGGGVAGETVDHYPPKGLFSQKRWPEGYVFPACYACNSGSKDADNWLAFMVRMNAGHDGDDPAELQEGQKLMAHFSVKHRTALEEMMLPTTAKRDVARRMGLKLGSGELFAELPIVGVPPEMDAAMAIFAPKLSKALHFQHTGRILPSDAWIKWKWFTNVNQMEGAIPETVFASLPMAPILRRGKIDLGEQFNYRFVHDPEGTLGMYTAWFRFSVCVVISLALNPSVGLGVENAVAAARAERGRGERQSRTTDETGLTD